MRLTAPKGYLEMLILHFLLRDSFALWDYSKYVKCIKCESLVRELYIFLCLVSFSIILHFKFWRQTSQLTVVSHAYIAFQIIMQTAF